MSRYLGSDIYYNGDDKSIEEVMTDLDKTQKIEILEDATMGLEQIRVLGETLNENPILDTSSFYRSKFLKGLTTQEKKDLIAEINLNMENS